MSITASPSAASSLVSGVRNVPHWIHGQRTPSTSGRYGDVFNPATGRVQARVGLARLRKRMQQ